MAVFEDQNRKSWLVEFDGLLLQDVLTETGVDLGDLSAGGLSAVEQSPVTLCRVLTVLCRDQWQGSDKLTARQFSKLIRGETITKSLAAIQEAAKSFFPPNQWSEIQSASASQREFQETWRKIQPVIRQLNQPDMESMRPAILAALGEMLGGMNLPQLEALQSAGGQAVTQSLDVSDSPPNAESVPAA